MQKISKFSGEIYGLQARLEKFALYKPCLQHRFACFEIDESYFKAKHKNDLDSSTKYLDYSKAYDGKVFEEIRILTSKGVRKISKFSGEIYVLQARLEKFALYKPACGTASLVLK